MSAHGDSLARDFRAVVGGARLAPRLDREHGGDIDRWARSAGIEAGEIIDFSASINPLGPPAAARKAFIKSYGEAQRYPDPYGEQLKEALAKHHEMKPAEDAGRQRLDAAHLSVVRGSAAAQSVSRRSGIFRIRQCAGARRREHPPIFLSRPTKAFSFRRKGLWRHGKRIATSSFSPRPTA